MELVHFSSESSNCPPSEWARGNHGYRNGRPINFFVLPVLPLTEGTRSAARRGGFPITHVTNWHNNLAGIEPWRWPGLDIYREGDGGGFRAPLFNGHFNGATEKGPCCTSISRQIFLGWCFLLYTE